MPKKTLEESLAKARDKIRELSLKEIPEEMVVHRCRNGDLALKFRSHTSALRKHFLLKRQQCKEKQDGYFKGGCFCIAFNPNSEAGAPNVEEVLDTIDAISKQKPYDKRFHTNLEIVDYDNKNKKPISDLWKESLIAKLKKYCHRRKTIDIDLVFHSNLFLSSGVINEEFVKNVATTLQDALDETSITEVNIRLIGCNSLEISAIFHKALKSKLPHLDFTTEATKGVCYVEMYALYTSEANIETLSQDPKIIALKPGKQIGFCHLSDESQKIITNIFTNPLLPRSGKAKAIPIAFDNMLTFTSGRNPPRDVAQGTVYFDKSSKTFFTSLYKKLSNAKKGSPLQALPIEESSRLSDEKTEILSPANSPKALNFEPAANIQRSSTPTQ